MNIQEYRNTISLISDSPKLDVDLLLMHILQKTRTELLLSLQETISAEQETQLNTVIKRRCTGEPIAYIVGHHSFWTMDLMVTPDTLIPRPETECLIDYVLQNEKKNIRVADLGTGSGAIALALALEKQNWQIDATDISEKALLIAKQNAQNYHANNIHFYRGNWYDALPNVKYDIIISNPPYIAEHDLHLTALRYEPQAALVSGIDGLTAIKIIVSHARSFLKPNGLLIIEHGFDQAEQVMAIFKENKFNQIKNHLDLSGTPRFTTGYL